MKDALLTRISRPQLQALGRDRHSIPFTKVAIQPINLWVRPRDPIHKWRNTHQAFHPSAAFRVFHP